MFTAPRPISIRSDILSFRGATSGLDGSLPAAGFTNAAGLRVWLLSSNEWSAFSPALLRTGQRVSSPSIWTADGVPAQIFVGNTVLIQGVQQDVGLRLDVNPRARNQFTEITAFLHGTEVLANDSKMSLELAANNRQVVRTNVSAGVRVLLPQGGTILLVTPRTDDGRSTGLVLTLDVLGVRN